MDIQAQKASIIEQFKLLNDTNLINAIQNLLDYALKKEQEEIEIPKEHQKLVMDRYEKVRKNPNSLIDLDEAQKILGV